MTRAFLLWLGAAALSEVGDGVLFFATAWTATGIGPGFAGLLLTLGLLPQIGLLLVGGAVADRVGLRRTLVACTAAMSLLLVGYVAARGAEVRVVGALTTLTVAAGVVEAFARPASGGLPRLFVGPERLSRAMALTGGMLEVARLAGPPLGGVVVAAVAMTGAVAVDLATFVVVLGVLVAVRPTYEPAPEPPEHAKGSTWGSVVEGLSAVRRVPAAPALLGAVALFAAALIPMLSISVPLAARERGWSAGQTGLVESAWIVGSLVVSLVVARVGTRSRPHGALVLGPLVALAGVVVVAAGRQLPMALGGAVVTGVGTATFTSHVFPAYLLATPPGMLARFQSLLVLVQFAPMLVVNNLLAGVAYAAGASASLLVVAVLCALAAVVVATSPKVRALRTESPAGAAGLPPG